jgi:hypothetical protein
MSKDMITSRRSFLKSGTIIAAPLAVIATPAVAALTDGGGRARLARIEDERAIETLNRAFLRRFNAGGHTGEFFANGRKPKLPSGVTALKLDATAEPQHFALSGDGLKASARFACTAEFEHELEGEGTFVQMARLQGNGAVRLSEARSFVANYVRNERGWAIERIVLA